VPVGILSNSTQRRFLSWPEDINSNAFFCYFERLLPSPQQSHTEICLEVLPDESPLV
jgi:hypothetical protein